MAEIIKSGQDWEAESDADTLIRATEIRMDLKRLARKPEIKPLIQ